ncbi:cytochrome c oxidase assembly factor 6-like [Populus alba x Populus x berolinensis]|nr:cytochrome c oxidase assembly factor 6-like [Populus alba x Populus x berolinensis]
MALETYASRNIDKIHTDVLSQSRQACCKARDAFCACLEKESDKKPTEIGSVGLQYPAECKDQGLSLRRTADLLGDKTAQRLLEDKEIRRGLPQPYTFKPTSSS